jgi:hypothetical protein
MRPNTILAEREGDLGGTQHKMTFDENSVAHLMSVLTDLYSDPELAVIREYSTNALDSQIEAGVSRPIEITTPNPLSPFFKVKDYGLGMDADDIQNIYSKYGASTKRESDSVVGMLGLGCKSALSYTQQFTLNAVKDGMKYMVAISRTEDGSGVMEIIDSSPTDEPNGVEVVVPVKRHNQFESKSFDFFRFWKPGTVLVNGNEPSWITGNPIAENIILVKNLSNDYLVMGNVAYPLDESHTLADGRGFGYYRRFGIVATVEIGSVNFTPSRESLHYTKRTEATVAEIRNTVAKRMTTAIQEHIDSHEGELEAWKAYRSWLDIFGGHGRQMPSQFSYKGTVIDQVISADVMVYDIAASRYAVQGAHRIALHDVIDRPVVYGYVGDKIPPSHREKMRYWKRTEDATRERKFASRMLVCEKKPELPDWLPVEYVSWEDIKKIKVPRSTPTGVTRSKPKFEVYLADRTHYLPKDEITQKEIILVQPKNYMSAASKKQIAEMRPGVAIVTLTQNRWDAFRKTHPHAVSFDNFFTELVKKTKDALTEEDLMQLSVNWYTRNTLNALDENRVDDPALANIIRFVKTRQGSDNVKRYHVVVGISQDVSSVNVRVALDNSGRGPLDNYPLVKNNMDIGSLAEDVYLYINAKYATMNK